MNFLNEVQLFARDVMKLDAAPETVSDGTLKSRTSSEILVCWSKPFKDYVAGVPLEDESSIVMLP